MNPDKPEGLKVLFFYLAVHLPPLEAAGLDLSRTLDPAEGWRHDGALAALCAMSEGDLIEEGDRLCSADVPATALYLGLEDGLQNGFGECCGHLGDHRAPDQSFGSWPPVR